MTKILNFALKSKGVVGRVAHAKSSDLPLPKNLKHAPGLAKLMHRTNTPTNIYSPYRTPEGELRDFWNGVLMSNNFHRPPKNQIRT